MDAQAAVCAKLDSRAIAMRGDLASKEEKFDDSPHDAEQQW
jgi:hypothetical protein